ncbi:DUF1450 domain-containing protein [Metabacillus sp. FJAT-53654]|uniref:DUF1450 domain-containing protein n=1 Tax=Metabacillus rhizosphaerae TaxID=3117747 RepID=A0ABZ2MSW7_9BACI
MRTIKKLFSKEKTTKIEFCEKNLNRFLTGETESEYEEAFLSQKNIKCKEYECQSWCKECKLSPYAIVNGEFITAVTSKELLKKIKLIVEKKDINL